MNPYLKAGVGLVLGSILWVLGEAWVAYSVTHNFSPEQVLTRWGRSGIPFGRHGGAMGDVLPLPLLGAWIVWQYGETWNKKLIGWLAVAGILITLGNHVNLILNQTVPDPFGWQGEKWSWLIAMHFVYMSVYIAIGGFFYFTPGGVSVAAAIWVSVIFGLHLAAGTHEPLALLNRWFQWDWCPPLQGSPGLQAGIWLLLSGFATIAAGWRAGLAVGVFGGAFVTLLAFLIMVSPKI